MKYKKIKLVISSLLATTFLVGCNLNKNDLEIGDILPTEETNKELDNKENLKTYAIVDENEKFGLIDKDGNVIVEPIYQYIIPFQKDLAKITINDKDGVIDKNKDIVIEPIYEFIGILKDDYISAKVDNFTNYIFDSKGNLILEAKNSYIEYLGKDLFSIKNDKDKVQVVNKNNEVIIPYEYNCSTINLAKEDLFLVYRPDKYGETMAEYLNFNGEPSISDNFSSASSFEDGVAVVSKENKFGAIDEKGNTLIEFKFDNLSKFKNEASIACIDNKFGIVNKQGEFTTEPKYDSIIEGLYNELYIAQLDGKYGVIDKDNNIKIPFKYDMIYNINKDTFQVNLDDKLSLVTKENKVILPLDSFNEASISNNTLLIEKEGKVEIIDLRNKESILKELNITYYMPPLNNSKIIKVKDKDRKNYYLNTETCKIVYKQ